MIILSMFFATLLRYIMQIFYFNALNLFLWNIKNSYKN